MKELSNRLLKVAHYVPCQASLLDVGSDHAYLPLYLAKRGKLARAIAGEVAHGPFQSAQTNIQLEHCEDWIEARLGDGLSVIHPSDEIDTVTICGMGGGLIRSILQAGLDQGQLTQVKRLILQPNVGEALVRDWLVDHQFTIVAEEILEEKGKIYEIIVADFKANPVALSPRAIQFGPFLMQERSPIWLKKLAQVRDKEVYILDSLQKAQVKNGDKINQQKEKIKEVEAVMGGE